MAKKETVWSEEIKPIKIKTLWPVLKSSILIKSSDLRLVKQNDLLYFENRERHNDSEIMLVERVFQLVEESVNGKSSNFSLGLINVRRRYSQSGLSHPHWPAEHTFKVIGTAYKEDSNDKS